MANIYDFTGKRVLVTGGGKGIGFAIVKKFLEFNATVIVLDKDEDLLQNLATDHPTVIGVKVDLTSWGATKEAIESVLPINHLVNNAGIGGLCSFFDLSEKDIDLIFDINFKSYVNVSQIVANDMRKRKIENATIVNVSSIMDSTFKSSGSDMYSCTKAAVTTLTKVMAKELSSSGIRVNCVRPSVTNTELIRELPEEIHTLVVQPMIANHLHNRLLETEEIADGVAFLSSNMSSMITGTSLTIDAGYELS